MLPFLPASFGDIVAAANIALSIYQVLNDSTGAAHDYRCLTSEICSLEHALRAVEHAISANPPSETLTENIKAETNTCLALLEKLQDDIKAYQKLSAGGKRAFWRKIGWVLFKVGKVGKFREELARRNQNIMLFLNALTILCVTSARADEANQSLVRIGYGNGNSVTVINAFGNPMTFPLELCFSPEKFHDTLMSYFKGKCGEGHVDRHDYSISTKDGRTFVESNNWGSVVKKGRVLVMSMIVKKAALEQEEGARVRGIHAHTVAKQRLA